MKRHPFKPGRYNIERCAALVAMPADEEAAVQYPPSPFGQSPTIEECGLPPSDPRHNKDEPVQRPVFHSELTAQYDPERGELSFIDELTTRVMQIRAGFEEEATLRACIAELELMGYTVTPPGEKPPESATISCTCGLIRQFPTPPYPPPQNHGTTCPIFQLLGSQPRDTSGPWWNPPTN